MAEKKEKSNPKENKVIFSQDMIVNLLEDLDTVSKRLTQIDHYYSRITVLNSEISKKEYFERLQKRKKELIEKILSIRKKGFSLNSKDFRSTTHIVKIKLEDQRNIGDYRFSNGKLIYPDSGVQAITLGLLQADQSPGPCELLQDYVLYDTEGKARISGFNSINHGSQTGFDIEPYNDSGVTLFSIYLNDHAAIWRDDNPDKYTGGYELIWKLPVAPCDMWVCWFIDAQQRIEFTNGADDGGSCKSLIAWATTDENGDFHSVNIRSNSIRTSFGNSSYNKTTDRYYFYSAFPIKQGKIPQIALAHIIQLTAQDGLVEAVGQFRTHQRNVDHGAPKIWYMMVPRNTGCFVTSAICDVLGKPDDCYELNVMREFRDTYVKFLPEGGKLIDEYYLKAPKYVAIINSHLEKKQFLTQLYQDYLQPGIAAIENREKEKVLNIYRDMLDTVEKWCKEKMPK